jgi:protein ImuB
MAGRRNAGIAVQKTLALPPVAEVGSAPEARPRPGPKRLWLCIYLPRLALDVFRRQWAGVGAVFEEQQGIRRILLADDEALSAGIEPGLSVNAALSLLPELILEERDPAREAGAVGQLAAWAERFTSFVVAESDDALLLEVAGSLRLFGGVGRIRCEVRRGLASKGLTAALALAPTPLASLWLARAGRDGGKCPDDMTRLNGRLAPVPLACVGWPAGAVAKMRGMGVTRIGDCLRLPRQGFARRFGVRFLNELDRALGRLPDPREHVHVPERFAAEYEFETEQDDRELILNACRELLRELERFLRVRQVQIQRIQFSFFHLQADATHLTLGCVQAGQGVDHWFDLLRIRFEQITLTAPAIAIRLRGGHGEAAALTTPGLLDGGRAHGASQPIERLVERLSARMGLAAVQGVTTVADHRPQHAWRPLSPLESPPHCAAASRGFWNEREMPRLFEDFRRTNGLLLRRPLWILDAPEILPVRDGHPWYQGQRLELEGPERLESGWWDEAGIARDYFVARNEDGVCLWVYRDRRSGCWYLHGMFG